MKTTEKEIKLIRKTVKDLKIFFFFIVLVVAGLLAAKYFMG
ncbi:hypothetical protein [Brevibacillus ruminantium]|nr:hypothetical protein [Brevibacillus ruminantium]